MPTAKTIQQTFQFGTHTIPISQLFLSRKHVYAMVNLKPLQNGHVLVCPKRITPKLSDLTELETLEFWCTVQEVSRVLADIFKSDCSIAIQNGKDAGQTVEHLHCHIIPKNQKQITNVDNENRPPRTIEEMTQEALKYRPYFEQTFL